MLAVEGGAFNGSGSVGKQRQLNTDMQGKAKMAIDTSGGGWRRWASAFDGSDGRRWVLAFDGGDGRKLCQWWTIKTAFNGGGGGGVRWRWQSLMAFDGTAMDYGKAMARQRRLAQLEDERAAQGEATQQPAGVMRG